MKKIGILTYHYSINEGAMLQAYALKQVCSEIFKDCNVEIINYESLREKKADLFFCMQNPSNAKAVVKKFKRYCRLNNFKNTQFDLSRPRYLGNDYFSGIEFLNNKKYDLIIVGSDEVWKVKDQYGFGKDATNVYWLGPEINYKKVSYAASAHKTLYNELSKEYKEFIVRALKEFKLIGVRDEHTFNMVKNCTRKESENRLFKVLDPTFLYDFSKENIDIDKLFLKNKIDLNIPIAVFALENKQAGEWAREVLKSKAYQIVAVGNHNKYADFNLIDQLNPLEWAAVFGKSNFCVTDRFHGTIFSIKNMVPFITVDHLKMYKRFKSKTKQLLEDFGLVENLVDFTNINYSYGRFADKIELVLNSFDRGKVNEVLERKKQESIYFLNKVKTLL